MKLTKTFRFEASHRLPFHQGKCARLHGHSWALDVTVEGPVDPSTGMVLDFYEITKVIGPIIEELDHHHLGTWQGLGVGFDPLQQGWAVAWLSDDFNATSENLLLELAKRISGSLTWSELSLHETCTSSATLTREEFSRSN